MYKSHSILFSFLFWFCGLVPKLEINNVSQNVSNCFATMIMQQNQEAVSLYTHNTYWMNSVTKPDSWIKDALTIQKEQW